MSDVKINDVVQAGAQVVSISSSQRSQGSVAAVKQESNALKQEKVSEQIAINGEKTEAQVKQAVTKLNDYVQSVERNLQFNLDDTSGKTIITVVDKDTSKVIRQIPDDVALKLAEKLQQSEPLSLFNAKV